MSTKHYFIFLGIIFFVQFAIPSHRISDDFREIYSITKAIGPIPVGLNNTIFFIRSNQIIKEDSMPWLIKTILTNKVDSIKHIDKINIKYFDFSNAEKTLYQYSCAVIIKRILSIKYYSLMIYLNPTENIIGISSLKWQPGFVEPAKENSKYAKKVKDLFLTHFKYSEYIGNSKNKCKVNDNYSNLSDGAMQFWKWFRHYEEYLYNYEKEKERIDQYITRKLKLIDLDIAFEIGEIKENKREIIIYGPENIKKRILKTVPKLRYWNVLFKNKIASNS